MRSRVVLVLAGVVAFVVAAVLVQLAFRLFDDDSVTDDAAAASEWVTVTGDGIRADFPRRPKQESQKVPTASGEVTATMYNLAAGDDGVSVSSMRLPGGAPFDLDGAVDGAAANTTTTIQERSPVIVDGAEGRSFRAAGNYRGRDATIFGTIAVKGRLMVMVQYFVFARDVTTAPDIYRRIVDSLAFTA